MFNNIALSLIGALILSTANAGLIVDTVEQDVFLSTWQSHSYSHNLLESGDDPFDLGSAISGQLDISIYDDKDDGTGWNQYELSLTIVEEFDGDTGGITFSNNLAFSNELEIEALAALNTDGMLDITIASLWGDFWVGDSVLTVNTGPVSVPEPALISLFGFGLIGLGVARRVRRKH